MHRCKVKFQKPGQFRGAFQRQVLIKALSSGIKIALHQQHFFLTRVVLAEAPIGYSTLKWFFFTHIIAKELNLNKDQQRQLSTLILHKASNEPYYAGQKGKLFRPFLSKATAVLKDTPQGDPA